MRFLYAAAFVLSAGAAHAAAPELMVAYPPANYTLAYDHVIFEGHVTPGASLSVDGRRLKVGPDGLFMEWLPLRPGRNALKLLSTLGRERRAVTLNVTFKLPTALPIRPTAIRAGSLTPDRALNLFTRVPAEARTLSIGFQGSPGGRASVTVAGLGRYAVPEQPTRARPPQAAGWYRLNLTLPENLALNAASVSVTLTGQDGRTVIATAPGHLTSKPAGLPRVTEVRGPDLGLGVNPSPTALATGLGVTDRLFPRQGQRLTVLGDTGESWLVLGPSGLATALKDTLTLLPVATPLPAAGAGPVQLLETPSEWQVYLPIEQRTLFELREVTGGSGAELNLLLADAAQPAGAFTAELAGASGAEVPGPTLSWAVQGTALNLSLKLPQAQLWGYFARYEGSALVLHVRKAPALDPAQPLRGRLILLDPGHGGAELGGAGSLGQPEKNLVLPIALRAAELLRAQGADVRLTRSSDVRVPLYDRPLLAEQLGADLLISIHANALPDGVDPRTRRGLEVHTFQPMSFGLAGALLTSIASASGLPIQTTPPLLVPGLRLSDLALARPTSQRSVLIELAYLTQADDLRFLMSGLGREALARGIAQGIADDYAAQARRQPAVSPPLAAPNPPAVPTVPAAPPADPDEQP